MTDLNAALLRPDVHRRQPVPAPTRCCIGQGGHADDQQDRRRASSTTRSTTRSSRRRARRYTRVGGPGRASAATRTSTSRGSRASGTSRQTRRTSLGLRGAGRVHPAVRQHARRCRSSSGCSWAASTACAASTSGRSARATRRSGLVHRRQQEPAVQRRVPDLRSPGPVRAGAVLRRGPGAAGASCRHRPGDATAEPFRDGRSSRRRPARRSGSSCRC